MEFFSFAIGVPPRLFNRKAQNQPCGWKICPSVSWCRRLFSTGRPKNGLSDGKSLPDKKQPLPKEGLPCVFVSAEAVAPDVPPETYAFAVCCLFLMTNSVPTTSAAPMMRQITAFCTKPATMNITKEIAATVAAYGICVFTWVRCSH